MARKRINPEVVLTAAEKQARYRASQKAKIEELKAPTLFTDVISDVAAMKNNIKAELQRKWNEELKAERISAERKKGRELAKKADQNYKRGRIVGICTAAAFFIGKDRLI